jgi:hypothetical protein
MSAKAISKAAPNRRFCLRCVLFAAIIVFGLNISATATDAVALSIVKKGHSEEVDTVFANEPYELRISIENDEELKGWQFGARFFESALPAYKAKWKWLRQTEGLDDSNYITVVPGCRMWRDYGAGTCWELNAFSYRSWDEISPDSIRLGGSQVMSGDRMAAGPLEHMLSIHFTAYPTMDDDGINWVDSLLTFFMEETGNVYPEFWKGKLDGGYWAVDRGYLCGDVDDNHSIDMLDLLYLIAYLYKGGPFPPHINAANVDKDGGVNMLDILFLIAYLYKGGPAPDCP